MKWYINMSFIAYQWSLPSWERGLKFHECKFTLSSLGVAPLVGAWIEICQFGLLSRILTVAPLVGAWIEIYDHLLSDWPRLVAPLVGAWIEIAESFPAMNREIPVAPLVGAWIEIWNGQGTTVDG